MTTILLSHWNKKKEQTSCPKGRKQYENIQNTAGTDGFGETMAVLCNTVYQSKRGLNATELCGNLCCVQHARMQISLLSGTNQVLPAG